MSLFILLIVVIGLLGFAARTYNTLRSRSEKVKRSNSDLTGEMRKRATLVNQLVDICRGYGEHEKLTHVTVAEQATSPAPSSSWRHRQHRHRAYAGGSYCRAGQLRA